MRSSYIYVVVGEDGVPQAGFTVKYELLSWLAKKNFQVGRVYRLRDPSVPNLSGDVGVKDITQEIGYYASEEA